MHTKLLHPNARAGLRLAVVALAFSLFAVALPGCQVEEDSVDGPRAAASRITQREQLIGGIRSLGAVGDFMLENEDIRVVVQDTGYSRGFGVFGGGIIDVDLRRISERNDHASASGHDLFGEMFPAYFLQALAPERVVIVSDGSDGGPAIIRVTGYAGDFLTLIRGLNEQLIKVFGGAPVGELSNQVPCQLGRYNGSACLTDNMDGSQLQTCEAPGSLVCTPQCKHVPRTNANGDVIGYNWELPESGIRCNPGVYEDATCSCINPLPPIPDPEKEGVTMMAEILLVATKMMASKLSFFETKAAT